MRSDVLMGRNRLILRPQLNRGTHVPSPSVLHHELLSSHLLLLHVRPFLLKHLSRLASLKPVSYPVQLQAHRFFLGVIKYRTLPAHRMGTCLKHDDQLHVPRQMPLVRSYLTFRHFRFSF